MAIILGGNGVDVAVTVGPNIVTDGLVFYTDPADSKSLLPKGNVALTEGVEIDDMYGLLADTQKVKFTGAGLPYYIAANQGYLYVGANINQNFYGTLSTPVLLGSSYTLDVWIAPRVLSSFVGSVWLSGEDNIRPSNSVNRPILQVQDNTLATYGYANLATTTVQSQWTNITVTTDPTTQSATYYVNGKFKGKGTQTITPINMTLKFIATSIFPDSGADGNMGPIKTYNRTLTAQEVYQNYNAMKSRYII